MVRLDWDFELRSSLQENLWLCYCGCLSVAHSWLGREFAVDLKKSVDLVRMSGLGLPGYDSDLIGSILVWGFPNSLTAEHFEKQSSNFGYQFVLEDQFHSN